MKGTISFGIFGISGRLGDRRASCFHTSKASDAAASGSNALTVDLPSCSSVGNGCRRYFCTTSSLKPPSHASDSFASTPLASKSLLVLRSVVFRSVVSLVYSKRRR
eukprot:Blabericola_migrator_1__6353@NODE_3202_length_1950_cov_21_450876_g2003_i0_p4_GENE_NODE_3202_length_1950_cov_21_450876_g2003_i0NODE_3202_length_1950_cov_21_450876_g2003_i0_p4_ORF_typecomplete_len106_score5_07DUF1644/PF07800_12/0_0087_NODE_3202_length_1950_cov_21_450876_g2003_i015341851